MKIKFNYKALFTALCLAGATLMAAAITPAYAADPVPVNDGTYFELDGNALDDSTGDPNPAPDDWGTPPKALGSAAKEFTGIVTDPAPLSIFDGGKKDIQDVSEWTFKDGAVPDKDNITNAYAAAYNNNGEILLYFGADRFSNVGDAYMGFWFFKNKVVAENGKFTSPGLASTDPIHSIGDILILVNFPQANNAHPYIAVVEWVGKDTNNGGCTKAASNDPIPGQCAAENLRLLSEGTSTSDTAVCDADDTACALTNADSILVPDIETSTSEGQGTGTSWKTYTPKSGTAGYFPYESFFEGGINLTALLPGDSCFSSFMAETRSSSSFTASLKDFVLDDFDLCRMSVKKECGTGVWNDGTATFDFPVTITVKNEGSGTMYNVSIVDNMRPYPQYTAPAPITLSPGESHIYSGNDADFSAVSSVDNTVQVYASSTLQGTATLRDTATATCTAPDMEAAMDVTKSCNTKVFNESGKLVVKVIYSGDVCNTSGDLNNSGGIDEEEIPGITLKNVTAVENDGGTPTVLTLSKTTLPPYDASKPGNNCATYSGSYYPNVSTGPDGLSGNSLSFTFMDTVKAEGYSVLDVYVTDTSDAAQCNLCPAP